MSITKGILAWLETCPYVESVTEFDINQVGEDEAGIYKEPSVTIEKLIDGAEVRTEYYYFLFKQAAQIKPDRLNSDTLLQNVEGWILDQEYAGNYPDIGYEVYSVTMSNGFYMMDRDTDTATYQLALQLEYERTINHD